MCGAAHRPFQAHGRPRAGEDRGGSALPFPSESWGWRAGLLGRVSIHWAPLGWVDEGRSEKPQAHKSEAWPRPWPPCTLAQAGPWGGARVGEGQGWEEAEIWDQGLVGNAIAQGVHKEAAHTGTSPGIFPLTSGWRLAPLPPALQTDPISSCPGAAAIQRVLATPGAWATGSEGNVPAWQEGGPGTVGRVPRLQSRLCVSDPHRVTGR